MIRDQYISSVVKSVIVSEKSSGLKDNGSTIVLRVLRDATKKDIKEAVEKLFDSRLSRLTPSTTPASLTAAAILPVRTGKRPM